VLEVATSRPGIKWFVVDGGPINVIESTGGAMLEALAGDLRARGIRLGFVRPRRHSTRHENCDLMVWSLRVGRTPMFRLVRTGDCFQVPPPGHAENR
jgi:hypothetical protein